MLNLPGITNPIIHTLYTLYMMQTQDATTITNNWVDYKITALPAETLCKSCSSRTIETAESAASYCHKYIIDIYLCCTSACAAGAVMSQVGGSYGAHQLQHGCTLLEYARTSYQVRSCCDICLVVEGSVQFDLHKLVLAAFSGHFRKVIEDGSLLGSKYFIPSRSPL